jgi:CrcB protein
MLLRGEYGWAALHTTWHLAGSIVMTALGILTYRTLAS